MLGLCALHLFARALSEYCKINKWRATICCNNQLALECSAQLPKNKTKLQILRHQTKLWGHKTRSLRDLCLQAQVWTHGQLFAYASTDNKAATKLCMRHTCKLSWECRRLRCRKKGQKRRQADMSPIIGHMSTDMSLTW